MQITEEVFNEYLNCKYKANLIINDEFQDPTEYEALVATQQQKYEVAASCDLLGLPDKFHTYEKTYIGKETLQQGPSIIIGAHVAYESIDFYFHALQKVPGASSLGTFHYIPVLFCGETMRETHRLLLSFGSLVLETLQGLRPPKGIAIYGDAYNRRKVDLASRQYRTRTILKELHQYVVRETAPRLRLNHHCRICRYKPRCKIQAEQSDDLSLLNRISEREIASYSRKGIFTVNQLSYTFRFRKRGKRVKAHGRPHSFALQALALREKCVFLVNKPTIRIARTNIFVDMEGYPTGSFIYLIGMLIVEDGIQTYRCFWADHRDDEEQMFQHFVECLSAFRDAEVFYYGSYEARVFRRILSLSSTEHVSELLSKRSTNVLSIVYATIYFPTYSNELKAIGNYLGCEWSPPEATGIQAHLWRKQWEDDRAASLKNALVTYNEQDCLALEKLATFVETLSRIDDKPAMVQGDARFIDSIKSDSDVHRWGKNDHVVKDFDLVVKCAYFDYQRHKVYLRTNANFKKINRNRKANERRDRVRPNKRIEVRSRLCPYCRSTNLHKDRHKYRSKLSLDLRFSAGGIKRWITRYCTPFHMCLDCERSFMSPAYRKKPRFGHGLISWSIDQHVANRLSFKHLERTCRDNFGLSVRHKHFHAFKSYAANYYSNTYKLIVKKLVRGSIIHADETKINLQKSSGYVWILTNMEEVVYFYRPSREAGFLHDFLADFTGILITDFYTGYDTLPYRQQKCLIHLIRDLNEDLKKNPFDHELQELGMNFGGLLRAIIETIDRFGLKRRNLRKHKKEADKFRDRLERGLFESAIVRKYRKRMLKYHTRLFAFLDYDGVPWNNNNAEHAVKHFAQYRRMVNGQMTENGLNDYLHLLTLYQTCRYKEINFLDFLLSGGRDIERFFTKL